MRVRCKKPLAKLDGKFYISIDLFVLWWWPSRQRVWVNSRYDERNLTCIILYLFFFALDHTPIIYFHYYQKLLEIEKEIVREVVRGDKHNLRKFAKSQRTDQCHSLRILHWFVLRNLQIFSGCVCHLEQLHAQSPFLFPISFGINLIPFFDIAALSLLCSGMCCFTWATARSQLLLFVVLTPGLWCFTTGCHVKSPLFPQPPLKQKCAPRWEKA